MKILFVSQNSLLRTAGTPKVLIELAESMSQIGWQPTLIQPSDLGMSPITRIEEHERFCTRLADYLKQNAARFDAIDYDHAYLPFPRSDFSSQLLMVARSALLTFHLRGYPVPLAPGPKAAAKRALRFFKNRREINSHLSRAEKTLREADLINLNNTYDKQTLIRLSFPADKIAVIALGLSDQTRALFDAISTSPPEKPTVGFVGTFDYRKGALDFPKIVAALIAAVPNVRFKLLGTAGLFQSADAVKAFFPADHQSRIEVIPRFDPEQLPTLLADVSIGIFPSYLEGFGLGVLEMLAAAVPVIAYDVPGPPMMLPPSHLVPAGDTQNMAAKAVNLLNNLAPARIAARESSNRFRWDIIARQTADTYTAAIQRKTEKAR